MGDHYQTIVDVESSLGEAEALAVKVVNFLVERRIVLPVKTDCVVGDNLGYPPGPNARQTVESPELFLDTLVTLGMEVITERRVHFSDDLAVRCPNCRFELVAWWASPHELQPHDWDIALRQWLQGDEGLLTCPQCDQACSLTKWVYDPPWAFGNLAFRFWNWTDLKEEFVKEIADLLGHKIAFVCGKL
jgi:hypothetical protein